MPLLPPLLWVGPDLDMQGINGCWIFIAWHWVNCYWWAGSDANAFVSEASAHDAYAYYAARTTTTTTNGGGSVPLSAVTGAACSDDGSPTTASESNWGIGRFFICTRW